MDKVKKNFQHLASIIFTVMAFILVVTLMSSFVLLIGGSKIEGVLVVSLCFVSVIAINIYLFYTYKRDRIAHIPALQMIAMVYNNVIFLSSLVPLFILGAEQSEAGIKAVVTNIYIFYGFALGLMLLGFLLTIYLIKESVQKSNWWVFVVSLPYIFTIWIIQQDYTGFNQFVHAKDFSYKNVAKMLSDFDADMLLLNPTWYKFLSVLIIVLVIMMGMIAVENVWKKTSKWRSSRQ